MAAQRMCDGETRQRSSEIGIPWGGMTERISGRQASHFHTDHRDDKDAAPGKSPSIDTASNQHQWGMPASAPSGGPHSQVFMS